MPDGPHLPPGPLPLPRCGSGRGRWDSYSYECNTIHDQPGDSGTATAEIIEDDLPDVHAFDALAVSSAGARHVGGGGLTGDTALLCPYVWMHDDPMRIGF